MVRGRRTWHQGGSRGAVAPARRRHSRSRLPGPRGCSRRCTGWRRTTWSRSRPARPTSVGMWNGSRHVAFGLLVHVGLTSHRRSFSGSKRRSTEPQRPRRNTLHPRSAATTTGPASFRNFVHPTASSTGAVEICDRVCVPIGPEPRQDREVVQVARVEEAVVVAVVASRCLHLLVNESILDAFAWMKSKP